MKARLGSGRIPSQLGVDAGQTDEGAAFYQPGYADSFLLAEAQLTYDLADSQPAIYDPPHEDTMLVADAQPPYMDVPS